MRVKQIHQHLDEGFLDLAAGFVTGLMMPTTSLGPALALIVTAASYSSIVKLAPKHRKQLVLTASSMSEITAQQKMYSTCLIKCHTS